MQAFLQPLHESIHKALVNFTSVADAPAMVGLSWEDLQGIEIQRAGFAVADLSTDWWPVPDMLFTLQFRKGGDKAQKIVAALQDAAANSGAAFEEIEVRGRKVMHGRIQSVDLFMGMGGDRLFITTRKARIEQIYAARDGELPKSPAASTRFKQIIDTMGAQRRG